MMKKPTFFAAALSLVLGLSACGGTDYDALAMDMCDCIGEMVDMYQEIEQAKATGNTGALQGMLVRLENTVENTELCRESIEDEYGDPFSDDREKTMTALCSLTSSVNDSAASLSASPSSDPPRSASRGRGKPAASVPCPACKAR